MHACSFDLNRYQACVSGLGENSSLIPSNIPTVVSVLCKGQGCECGIYVWFIGIGVPIGIEIFCCGYGRCKYVSGGGLHQSVCLAVGSKSYTAFTRN